MHERGSVKIINLDANESLICFRALMIAQISAVKMDAESDYFMEIMVSDEKKKITAHATEFPSCDPFV